MNVGSIVFGPSQAPQESMESVLARAVAAKAPQAAGAPPQRPHGPCGAMTAGEADAWRAGWAAHEAATLRLVSPRWPSLAAQVVMIAMPAPMREPTGLDERGA